MSALESSVRRHGREIVFYMDTVVLPESVQAAAELRGTRSLVERSVPVHVR